MLSVSLGPLTLPVAPLIVAAALVVATAVLRWRARAQGLAVAERSRAENLLWWALLAGLAGARLGFVGANAAAYAASPLAAFDIRDGGWSAPVGLVTGLVVLGALAWRRPASARALGWSGAAGLALWVAAGALLGSGPLAAWLPAGGAIGHSAGTGARLPAVAVEPYLVAAPAEATAGGTASTATHTPPHTPPHTNTPAPASASASAATGPLGARTAVSTLAALHDGRPMVVNLWATWCTPCRAEMPALAAAQRAAPDVRFIFLNQGETVDRVRFYLERERLGLSDVWLDAASAAAPAVGSRGLPTTLFVDAQGRIAHAHMGQLNGPAIAARLADLRTRR